MGQHLAAPRWLIAVTFIAALLPRAAAAQSITIDGTLSAAQTLTGPSYTIGASLGKQVGANLFQSFGKFGLLAGESATFTGPAGIANIIGRVTGGSPSSIDGAIVSAIQGANLFLINPFGIVFGAGASVNVSGSFHASTADYVKLSDGKMFSATNPQGSTFSAAAPAAFGFLNASPPAITVTGSAINVQGTLGLVGGPVTISGGALSAPGGTIHIASAAGTGEIPVDPVNGPRASVRSYGPVRITQGALLDVSSGGSVFIRAGTLTLDASEIDADNSGTGPRPGGEIALRASRRLVLADGADIHASSLGEINAGDLTVRAGSLAIGADSRIASDAFARGKAGNISVDVAHALTIDGRMNGQQTQSGILSDAERHSRGRAGRVSVRAGRISIFGNGEISSSAFGRGNGGEVSVAVRGRLLLDGAGGSPNILTGITSQTHGAGNSGSVNARAGKLTLTDAGEIASTTFGAGNGGDVSVAVSGLLSIDGISKKTPFTGITANSAHRNSGNAGDMSVNAGELSIVNTGEISSGTFGAGNSGNVSVAVGGLLLIDGIPGKALTGITAETSARKSTGNAGNVTVNAGELSISHGGEIASDTFGTGAAGNVDVTVSGAATIADRGEIIVDSENRISGNAGTVTLRALQLSLDSGGKITSETYGVGNSGDVDVTVPGMLSIGRNASIIADSKSPRSGNAGLVVVSAGELLLVDGGIISSSTFGSGTGGDVVVVAGGLLSIDGISPSTPLTGITAQTQGAGDAGSVKVSAGQLSIVNTGEIASNTFASGNSGSISISVVGQLTLASGASIVASSENAHSGNAGNIGVNASALTIVDGGEISSSTSGRGTGGDVVVAVGGLLSIDGISPSTPFTGITAQTQGTGAAGSIVVSAGQLSIVNTGEISSDTFGAGSGGNVSVSVAGTLAINGGPAGTPFVTGISAGTNRRSTGAGGDVTIVAGNIVLSGPGPQITAQSLGTGDAGSIVVNAGTIEISDGASISTAGSTAKGGNITLSVADLLYLRAGEITTSSGGPNVASNGGKIMIDPLLVVLADDSMISANAFHGNGGNILIEGTFLKSFDSAVTATSQKGISGTIAISGQFVSLNGALVVLPSVLRGAEAILRSSCAARRALPQSSFVASGRGGLPQDPQAVLPALYLAPRAAASAGGGEGAVPALPRHTAIRLTMRCG